MYMTGALTAGRRLIAYPQDTSGVRNLTGSSEPATGVTRVGPAARRSPRRRLRLRAASYPRSIQICMDRGPRVRLPNAAHTSRPWRIHEFTPDFRLEDVWALPTPGGPDDFPRLVQQIASGDPAESSSPAAQTLWAIRWKVGELLGLDAEDAGLGSRVATLRARLPADLRQAPSGP